MDMKPEKDLAIRNTHPTVVTIKGEGDTWTAWDESGDIVVLDEDLVSTELVRLLAEYDAQAYARNRKAEYDQLNQFELISDDSINGTTTHKDAILAIKAKYPKE
jgi:hypothetical protein